MSDLQTYSNTLPKDLILIIDDQPSNLKFFIDAFKAEFRISIANSGANALHILSHSVPDLILLDVMMPEMDGYEVIKRIKDQELLKDIPVIFCTAKTETDDLVKGFRHGAVDYVTKPFNIHELRQRIRNHLALSKSKKQVERMMEETRLANINLRAIEQDLTLFNKELTKSNADKDLFIGVIAHDLKTPFNVINGLSQMLLEEIKEQGCTDLLELAEPVLEAGTRAVTLLNNLMQWVKGQNGQLSYKPFALNLHDLTRVTLDLLAPVSSQKAVEVINSIPPVEVVADADMLSTVIRNLVANAIKFSHRNTRVVVDYQELNNEHILSVTDEGVGMSEEVSRRLFNFTEFRSTAGTEKEEGTGLGLILCHDFVKLHGGRIWAESQKGKGSTFRFTLPITQSGE